ncbi:MAG: hypothetical protein WCA13_07380 [Terriglobales bacterium]
MRPYLVLTAVVLMTVAAFAQQPFPYAGPCLYGCGPYIPMLTTPQVSLQTFSPNPVGASDATTGLIAGATNSTLSQIEGSTSSEYTTAVWYQGGGAPLITPDVHLWPEPIGGEGHVMRGMRHEERPPQERFREERPREDRIHKERAREEHAAGAEAHGDWTYFTGRENTTDATSVVKGFRKAAHAYNNDDVTRLNDKNGAVKYDGKTEKM